MTTRQTRSPATSISRSTNPPLFIFLPKPSINILLAILSFNFLGEFMRNRTFVHSTVAPTPSQLQPISTQREDAQCAVRSLTPNNSPSVRSNKTRCTSPPGQPLFALRLFPLGPATQHRASRLASGIWECIQTDETGSGIKRAPGTGFTLNPTSFKSSTHTSKRATNEQHRFLESLHSQ